MKHEIPLPLNALEAIVTSPLSTDALRDCPNFDHKLSDISPSWFEATQINLDGRPDSGLLVRGNQDCLHGAHIVQFWILAKTANAYKTLFTGRSDAISLLKTRTNGYRDLELTFIYAAGADIESINLRYSGNGYKIASRRVRHQ